MTSIVFPVLKSELRKNRKEQNVTCEHYVLLNGKRSE